MQLPEACKKCRRHRAYQSSCGRCRPEAPVIREQDFRKILIHYAITIYDNQREYLFPDEHTEYTAAHRRVKRILQIFGSDVLLPVAKRLHRTDLCPLLLDHPCHRCQADQCRHKEKDKRKHLCDICHTLCIFSISRIIRELVAVIHIPLRLLQIRKLPLRIRDLLFRICELLLRIRNLLLAICDLIRSLLLSVLIILPAVGDLLLILGKLLLPVRDLLPSVGQLLACL